MLFFVHVLIVCIGFATTRQDTDTITLASIDELDVMSGNEEGSGELLPVTKYPPPVDWAIEVKVAKRSDILKQSMKDYDRRQPPSMGMPVIINISITIAGINEISETDMDYSMTFFLFETWTDQRLRFKTSPGKNISSVLIKVDDPLWEKLWTPDVFFRNEKKSKFHRVTIENRYIRVFSNGNVEYAARISATLTCVMDLSKYPLDTQKCPLIFESFSTTSDRQLFQWSALPIVRPAHMAIQKFKLVDVNHKATCQGNYISGNFSCLNVMFTFKRDIRYYLIQMYFPSTLVVILSWVAFWISFEAVPARVTIGLLTILTMTTQNSSAQSQLPRVSYVKALDVWMSVCIVYVFASMIEFAIVNVTSRKDAKKQQAVKDSLKLTDDEEAIKKNLARRKIFRAQFEELSQKEKARKIDKLARKVFPGTFVLFNVVYWLYYLIEL